MPSPVTRLYATSQQAADAVRELQAWGYSTSQINVVPAATAGADRDAIVRAIMSGNVLKGDAVRYAEHVLHGRTLVSVGTIFGRGAEARTVLDNFDPVSAGFEESGYELSPGWDEATPLSSALGLPVLVKPTLRFLGIGELTRPGWLAFNWLPQLTSGGPILPGKLLTNGDQIVPGPTLIRK